MTPILFLIGYFLGLTLTLVRNPVYGLYTYLFTFYMAPNDSWWSNNVPDLRYLFIAGVIAVIGTLRLPSVAGRTPWYRTTPGRLILLFVLYNWIQIPWAVSTPSQFDAAFLFTKHLIIFYVIYQLATSMERIREIAIVHVVGCAWFGYQALGAGGGRLEKVGGAVAGANELGVHISTGLIFGGILLLSLHGIRRWVVFASLPLVANTLVLTVSRGAFLGFLSAGISGFFLVPKRIRRKYAILGLLGLLLVGMLAHQDLIERFKGTYIALTTDEQELDRSASSRVEITKAGIAIGLAHPFGAGNQATELLSGPYISGWNHGRSAHNTFAGIFAEHGFPGLFIYIALIVWVLVTLWRMRRPQQNNDPEEIQISAITVMAGASLLGIYVSGNFSSNIDLETQYWCLAILAAALELKRHTRCHVEEAQGEAALGVTSRNKINPTVPRIEGGDCKHEHGKG